MLPAGRVTVAPEGRDVVVPEGRETVEPAGRAALTPDGLDATVLLFPETAPEAGFPTDEALEAEPLETVALPGVSLSCPLVDKAARSTLEAEEYEVFLVLLVSELDPEVLFAVPVAVLLVADDATPIPSLTVLPDVRLRLT